MTDVLGLDDVELSEKKVLIRVDFNVPINDGEVGDDTRIQACLPTLAHALEKGAAVILMSHLGRPKEGEYDEALSLLPVTRKLSLSTSASGHTLRQMRSPWLNTKLISSVQRETTAGMSISREFAKDGLLSAVLKVKLLMMSLTKSYSMVSCVFWMHKYETVWSFALSPRGISLY